MQRKFDLFLTQKIIDILMKLAGVIVTSVATWSVAQNAFSYLSDPWLSLVCTGALMLVEGAFIASWMAIDTQHHAPPSLKMAWAATLVIVYVALLIVALAHGEGSAGWAFRFVLAVMIGRSIYEAGVYELVKRNRQEDRNIRSSYAIRRIERRNARQNAIFALQSTSDESNYVRELQNVVERARMEAEHEVAIQDIQVYREMLLERVHAKNSLARGQMLAAEAREGKLAEV